MKKLAFILSVLFSLNCCSQITITKYTSEGIVCTSGGTLGVTFTDIPFTAGHLYVLVNMIDSTSNYGSRSGISETFDVIGEFGNFARRIGIYRMVPNSSSSTEDLTVSWSSSFPGGIRSTVYDIAGVPPSIDNGASDISQFVIDSSNSANPTITLAPIHSGSAILSVFINNTNPFSGSPESGWTEIIDGGCTTSGTYTIGYYHMDRTSTSDNTPTVTASSSTWMGIALEFIGTRRVMNIR